MKKQRWRFTKGYWDWKCWDCDKIGFNKSKKCNVPKGWIIGGLGYVYVICKECADKEDELD